MAEKKLNAVDIQKLVKEKRLVFGTNKVLKGLKQGKFESILTSKNTPEDVMDSIKQYSKIGKVEMIALPYTNEELGVVCKQSFSISVIGMLKEKK